jgi:hypothetical protein
MLIIILLGFFVTFSLQNYVEEIAQLESAELKEILEFHRNAVVLDCRLAKIVNWNITSTCEMINNRYECLFINFLNVSPGTVLIKSECSPIRTCTITFTQHQWLLGTCIEGLCVRGNMTTFGCEF